MTKEIAFKNGRISTFQGLVTLTLDWVILHTVVHHSSTYVPSFTEIDETFCGWKNVCTHVWADRQFRPALLGRLCRRVDLKMQLGDSAFNMQKTARLNEFV